MSKEYNNTPKLPELKAGIKVKCKVLNWNNSFVYVELVDYKEIGSIYIRNITGKYIESIDDVLTENQEVMATVLLENRHPVFGYSLTLI